MTGLSRTYAWARELKAKAIKAIAPSRMHFSHYSWQYSWPLVPDVCPCDVHFCEYLKERNVRGKALFHFGTGGHHLVGLQNHDLGLENEILGITASPAEHARYVTRIIRTPSLGRHYKVLFADIYNLSGSCLPTFHLATLFHLCEYSDAGGTGRRLNDSEVLELFLSKMAPEGRLLFYSGSFAHRQAAPIIDRAVVEGRMSLVEAYKSLLVYQVPTRTIAAS